MALGAFEFTAEQVEVLRAEQANPNCKFAGVVDLSQCTDEAMIVQMGAALRRASVELTEEQQRALGGASEFTYTDMAQRGNRDFEAVRIPDPEALTTEELIETREYARDVETDSLEEVIAGCVASLRRYGVRIPLSAPPFRAARIPSIADRHRRRCVHRAVLRRRPRRAEGDGAGGLPRALGRDGGDRGAAEPRGAPAPGAQRHDDGRERDRLPAALPAVSLPPGRGGHREDDAGRPRSNRAVRPAQRRERRSG